MESFDIIKYKWQSGVYGLKEMIDLVNTNTITQEQFSIITGYDYYGILSIYNKKFKLS